MKSRGFFSAGFLLFTCCLQTQAAKIVIDDRHPTKMTITASDFENDIYVDGSFLQSGIGSASVTLPDTGHTILGGWVDLGAAGGKLLELLFAESANPSFVTSGVVVNTSSDGFWATVDGSSGGYIGIPYFFTAGPTFDQQGTLQSASIPTLTVVFIPEHFSTSIPDGGNLVVLLLLGLGSFGLVQRKLV